MSHPPVRALDGESRATAERRPRADEPSALHASIMRLHRGAGNRAVAGLLHPGLVQRKVGWTQTGAKQGRGWNRDQAEVGDIHRIPLEGFGEGLKQAKAWTRVTDPADPAKKKRISVQESTDIAELSPETAVDRAIVLMPAKLDARQKIEVVVFLHGFTEGTHRPFAGWRELSDPSPGTGPKATKDEKAEAAALAPFRQGIDKTDTAPVRDVALDEAETQLQESGQKQLLIVLPQGGLHSQFGKDGDRSFDAKSYVDKIVARLGGEGKWTDGQGHAVTQAPDVGRLDMAGHSGAGATLANMADASVAAATPPPKSGKAPPPPKSSPIGGDLVIYDAINSSGDADSFFAWAKLHLEAGLKELTDPDPKKTEQTKLAYLAGAPKLRGFYTSVYKDNYKLLDDPIHDWFDAHVKQLGVFAGALRANFAITPAAGLEHEEEMRGHAAGTARKQGEGNILAAINFLHAGPLSSASAAPPLPPRIK